MATHTLTFNLTTDQVIALNSALDEHYEANADAIADSGTGFSDAQKSHFQKQCEALDVLINSIKKIVEPKNAK